MDNLKETSSNNGLVSHFLDQDGEEFGTAHFLPHAHDDQLLTDTKNRANYCLHKLLHDCALKNKDLYVGPAPISQKLYDTTQDALNETYVHIWNARGQVSTHEWENLARGLTQLFNRPVSFRTVHLPNDEFYYYMDGISIKDLSSLSKSQLTTGNKLIQNLLGSNKGAER
jgi:hypothetical protein